MKRLLAKQLAWLFVSVAALGCNMILDNDDPSLVPPGEEPIDAMGDAPKNTRSPDGGVTPPATDGSVGDAKSTDGAAADHDGAGMTDNAVPPPDAPGRDAGDAPVSPPDATTTPDVTTPPPDVTTTPDVTTPPPDVTIDKTTSNDAPGRDADASSPPDGARDGTAPPPDVKEAGIIDVIPPPTVDAADGCTLNPCGGCAELSGTPGAACGSCGTFACNADKNSVNCNNDPGLNACNGCGTLSGTPGAKCGSCGTFTCSADKSSVNCDNDTPLNACNGCGTLSGTPGAKCGSCGTFTCSADKSSVNCDNDTPLNACGGCSALSGVPGAKCGSCGSFACNADKNSVNCDNDTGLNACGGCGVLAGAPGAKCATCGAYACSTDKSSVNCDHPDPLSVKQLAAGDGFTCAVLTTGAIRCWGKNDDGELGDNTKVSTSSPPAVNAVSDVSDFSLVSLGASHACAMRTGGTVRCWGSNSQGQIGTDVATTSVANLMGPDVLGGATGVGAVGDTTCAVLGTGTARCWGYGLSGDLGDGTFDSRSTTSVPVLSLTNATAISGTCALLTGGTMSCWGAGGSGALGDGLGMDSNVPVNVVGLTKISAFSASGDHTCAVSSGSVYCWGFNAFGQCGDGLMARNIYMPESTGVQTNATTVGAGAHNSCALLNTGRVRCWGENYNGEVGDGTMGSTAQRNSPVDVVGLSGVASLAVGAGHNCALLTTGAIRCWGSNAFGQLGDGTFTNRSTPVDIPWMCP